MNRTWKIYRISLKDQIHRIRLHKGVELWDNGIEILFSKIIQKFSTLGKDTNIQEQALFRTPNRNEPKRTSSKYIKVPNIQNKTMV
jgi:hypothetical protein